MTTPIVAESKQKQLLNIAAYKFVTLDDLPGRRERLKRLCLQLELRGTILLSPEGINLFMAGAPENIQRLLDTLRQEPEFADLETKESYCKEQPFRRMLVRLKQEIIAFGVDGICPERKGTPKLSAGELRQWLDEGRAVRLLDVRNNYEFDLGTFRGAQQLDIGHFRDFPAAIEQLPESAKQQPLVMFCTGGIRCEKAGPLMEQAGFEEVYQLDGGILKYFEECGGAHYDGACFVFDGRVALDSQLNPTGNLLCFACQAVLSPDDVSSEKFLFGKYCPHCYQDPETARRTQFAARQAHILEIARSQPGSRPYTNVRRMFVPRKSAGLSLIDFLDAWHPQTGRQQWHSWLASGQISHVSSDWQVRTGAVAERIVRDGDCFEQLMPDTVEPDIQPEIELLHEDEMIVVVNKPAPLPVHPSGRFNRNTLTWILSQAYPNEKLRVAHRLDADTTGIIVLCRKYQAARHVQPQFSNFHVAKGYIARVHGHPAWQSIACTAAIGKEPAENGSRQIDPLGQSAQTDFKVLRKLADGTALVEAIPRTGRTHQIRLHAWHVGHPIVGDRIYMPPSVEGAALPNVQRAWPLCLHAASISLNHPQTRQSVTFSAPVPNWADEI